MTYQQFINQEMKRAQTIGKEGEAIKLLILELSNFSGSEFVLNLHKEIPLEHKRIMDQAIDEYLLKGIPVQHILGYSYFFGYKLIVNSNVLIPRYETEELIEHVLYSYDEIFSGKKVDVVDLGTGSGAIAIALAKEEQNMNVYATDISSEALKVARQNAINNQAPVTFLEGSWLTPLIENNLKFDIIVSNPPYIPESEDVEAIVKDHEPHLALFGGKEGLDFYDEILKNAHQVLRVPGMIAFEHSYNKQSELVKMAKAYFPKAEIETFVDMQGKDRILMIKILKEVNE